VRHDLEPFRLGYTRMVTFREEWRGHLWQGRFASFVLEGHFAFQTIMKLARARILARAFGEQCSYNNRRHEPDHRVAGAGVGSIP